MESDEYVCPWTVPQINYTPLYDIVLFQQCPMWNMTRLS